VVSVPGEIVVDHPDGFLIPTPPNTWDDAAPPRASGELSAAEIAEAQSAVARAPSKPWNCEGMAASICSWQRSQAVGQRDHTIPGFTQISMYPKLMQASGFPPRRSLVSRLIDESAARASANAPETST